MRLHSDRAREFLAAPLRRWAQSRDIVLTKTAGDDYKANGRCEAELGVTKRAIRTVISAGRFNINLWPLVARHVGERRLRAQLRSCGYPVGDLLKFGTQAFALRKWWQDNHEEWGETRQPVLVLGPDACSTLTSTNYFVQSIDTGKYFFTADVITPDFEATETAVLGEQQVHEGAAPRPIGADNAIYLPERDEVSRPAGMDLQPARRLRGKTKPAMLHRLMRAPIEGEDDPFEYESFLQKVQRNLHMLVMDEMVHIDGTADEQAWCMPVLKEMLVQKAEVEEELIMINRGKKDENLWRLVEVNKAEDDEVFNRIWTVGILPMVLGAIYAGQLVFGAVRCCLRRMQQSNEASSQCNFGKPITKQDVLASSEEEALMSEDEGEPTSLRVSSRSGLRVGRASSSECMSSRSGLHAERAATSGCMTSSSGMQSSAGRGNSGPISMDMTSSSGSHGECLAAGSQITSRSTSTQSGFKQRGGSSITEQRGASSAAGFGAATSPSTASGSASVSEVQRSPKEKDLSNPWNKFQHENRGKGLSKATLAKIYQYEKAKHNKDN
ncbi:unnamed protein product [Cladocopium goreaui]|uniref:Copia protein n=1 Tax=Cladocopium goreaui TaxID=2562237 RepID=A0A9P1BKY4_9DINO|nr:unnamed protein product [Cladocopium goreaui]